MCVPANGETTHKYFHSERRGEGRGADDGATDSQRQWCSFNVDLHSLTHTYITIRIQIPNDVPPVLTININDPIRASVTLLVQWTTRRQFLRLPVLGATDQSSPDAAADGWSDCCSC